MKVGIIGLGYVGLPLAIAFAEAGYDVVGLDADRAGSSACAPARATRVVAEFSLVLDFRGVTRGIRAENLVRL